MSHDPVDRFAEELRRWTERPGTVSPAAARTRVLAALDRPRHRAVWRFAAVGATLVAAVLAVVLVIGRRDEPITPSSTAPTLAGGDQRTIVHQLSSGTQLYIVLRPGTFQDEY